MATPSKRRGPTKGTAPKKDDDRVLAAQIFAALRKRIPRAQKLAEEALVSLLGNRINDKNYIKNNFSRLIHDTQIKAYELYQAHEKKESGRAIREVIKPLLPEKASADDVFKFLMQRFGVIDRFCLSLSQGRRSRAGTTFENVVTALFKTLEYPYTPHPMIGESRPDYVLPSIEHYEKYGPDCIIFTCKRTLRERWRQVVTEGLTGRSFFLATVDHRLSAPQIEVMKAKNVVLVVPDTLKKERYTDALNVITFEYFFDHYLDPAMKRWKLGGAV